MTDDSADQPVTVLVNLPGDYIGVHRLADRFPSVRFVDVDPGHPIDPDVHGEVLVTRAAAAENLADLLDRGVRWVHCTGHGVDGLPLELVGGRVLTCARGTMATPIAEWVVAMILTVSKRLPGSWVDGPPKHWFLDRLTALEDATVALIGFGSINRAVSHRLAPFGCRLVATRRGQAGVDDPAVEVVPDAFGAVSGADHVVIGVPATPGTNHLFDDDLFAAMKPGGHLVNVARGSIVDQAALRRALDSGQVGVASLDVCEPEPLPEGHWLYTHPGVRLSPHVSWCSPGAVEDLREDFSDNLERWLDDRALKGVVDVEAGY